ncbi:hypothetical protein L249_2114 [Ophiocordyceps polyrhachis-furcata BCC 54312]|uniref:Uncharacterized protein n=1 Tax=Ophiocordyceps polyrhachis-furcata BCC 54312 TaxID=1330021 RepID=A0A367LP25_9HYPO|nr:hypothetical protein L249_2114 [Ophiocordyceps polyrhachis-furcata BCC 54312]
MPRPKKARREPPVASNDETVRRRGRPRKSTAPPNLADETVLGAARRKRDAALDTLAKEDATSSVVGEGGRAVTATPLHRRHNDSGLDLADDDVFGALDDDFADDSLTSSAADDGDQQRRRRPRSRQSSIVGPNDPPIRPSSRGPNTPGIGSSFNVGLFRRRAREPSILGTSRKPLPERKGEVMDEPSEERPTPSSLSRSRKRKSGGDDGDDGDDDDDNNDNARENLAQGSSSSSLSDVVIDSDSDLSVLASPLTAAMASLPSAPRPVTPTNRNEKDDDEVAAPPASSGSENDADAGWPDIHGLAKRRRRPSALMMMPTLQTDGHHEESDDNNNNNNMSSPPSLTHSPNIAASTRRRGRGIRRRRASSPPKLTTEHLTNLLPKRRQRKRLRYSPSHSGSDGELDTTDLAPDEDELAHLDVRSRRGARRPRQRDGVASSAHGEGSVLKPRQTASSTRQPRAAAAAAAKARKPHTRRSSDKENEDEDDENEDDDDDDDDDDDEGEEEGESALVPLPDNTFDSTPDAACKPADELKKAARKFKEVDRWELDFEEVTESPSSQDAR